MKTLAIRREQSRGATPQLARLAILAWALAVHTGASAQDINRGRQLYENHCQACHSSLLHTPVKSRIQSFKELEARVSAWSVHAAIGWTAEEVRDVSYYLDHSFYHFGVRGE